MKFIITKLLLLSMIIIGITCRTGRASLKTHSKAHLKTKTHTKTKTKTKTHLKTTYWVRPLIKTARSYHSFANLPYCPDDIINKLACPLCHSILDNSFQVFKHYKHKHQKYTFTFVILYSTNRNEVVITFSGPRRPHPAFYSTVYSRGFMKLMGHPDIMIERTYLDIYQSEFSKKLFTYIQDYNDKFNVEEKDHKYVFVGHSFGGALAVLAAFDMSSKKVVPVLPSLESPIVYSYGQLRIGNSIFVNQVNSIMKVVRVAKEGDLYPRMPTCTWSPSINRFRCERDWDFGDINAVNTKPELLNYIQNYYGPGQLEAGVESAYKNRPISFLEKKVKKEKSETAAHDPSLGWSYAANNPGYKIMNLGDPFDEHGRTNDAGAITYSQPLGAEVLFSNNFKRHKICSYFYGIPTCERELAENFSKDAGSSYFNSDLTDC